MTDGVVTFADLQEAAGLGRKLDVDTSSVRLLREIARLRDGIARLRIDHRDCTGWDADQGPARFPCDCGADAHNARIDALLRGDP